MRVTINPGRIVRSGTGRCAVLVVGLGAAGVAIGWLGPGRLSGAQPPAAAPARRR
ncbi:hypothetical protein Acsp04_40730 [Actinomadura sp. NBRC 104425]|uniref:hypothetical protein n=1 Tax=Actinomadura sp. NBRC 104425 TaxID=3032204 RepID=UPI0024A10E27|nr:hypothetical protein [Actinomadura sp. NBRC 104425]GLZ13838.1 hypothetical protein Acsp04_40730 [Actinomadura sp. NBRC 104425]